MSSPFADLLGTLVRQRGVMGGLVVSESDGIIVDATLQVGIKGNVVAALAASLFRKARLSSAAAGLGEAMFLTLEAEHGRVCAAGRSDLILVTIADPRTNLGLLRVEMLKGLEGGTLS
jgi:predicted regulator of Ras-like GTPase activity (Roadblock/LC7/MglB family)